MLDMRWIDTHPDKARRRLTARGNPVSPEKIRSLDAERRRLPAEIEQERAERNRVTGEMSRCRGTGIHPANLTERMLPA